MPDTKSTNPPNQRRPGGHGRRTGELLQSRTLKEDSKRALDRIRVMRDPLWELQPSETIKAYEKFRYYRDLGDRRTHKIVAEHFGVSYMTIDALSSKYRWVERVTAFAAYYDTVMLAAQEQEIRAAAQSWVARQSAIREMEYELSMGLAQKVREMLAYPIRTIRRHVESKDGKRIYVTIIEPARWDWKAAADILGKLAFQARLSGDMVTDGARAPTPDMTDRGVADIDAWLNEIGVSSSGEKEAEKAQ